MQLLVALLNVNQQLVDVFKYYSELEAAAIAEEEKRGHGRAEQKANTTVSEPSLYLMPEHQPYTTFHLTDPVVLPPFPEPHQAIPQTHWQYPSVEPRTAPFQQVSVSRAPQVEPRRLLISGADAYAWDPASMDWFTSTNGSSTPD